MLGYASRLTEAPSLVDKQAVDDLREQGWNEAEIWELTALTALFNMTGRLEAASGLPPDRIPSDAQIAEADAG